MDNQDPEVGQTPQATRRKFFAHRVLRNGGEYLFQFFMLFLAVVAGFYADNLREDFAEERQTSDYAKSIVSDLARDSSNLNFQLSVLASTISGIDSLADYVRDKKLEELDNGTLFRLTRISPNPAFRWNRATIQQIKSSGSLRNFTNEKIAKSIAYYDALTIHLDQDNAEDQERYHDATNALARVVNLNYPLAKKIATEANGKEIGLTIIAHDLQEVAVMTNAYLIARRRNVERQAELHEVLQVQYRLVTLLKKEYRLN